MARNFANDVEPIFEPCKLAASRGRKDCDLAVLALIPVLRYVLAVVSETRFSVVW